jgi:hypothetical protein
MSSVNRSLERLEKYLETKGYEGYDPYDLKGMKWVVWLIRESTGRKILEILRELTFELFYRFPVFFRWLFKTRPRVNAKAMGLLARAYLDLYRHGKDQKHYDRSRECLDWLSQNNVPYGAGTGWGYPFDWQSVEFIPENTPNGIVTTVAGDAYWSWYRASGAEEHLGTCISICNFLSGLPMDVLDEERVCFSYTPLYINHVHNLNLFVAEFLIKVGMETGRKEWVDLGNRAVNYTISDQMDNGAFDYNGPPEKHAGFIDNYHTGFVLRMLFSIWKLTGRKDVHQSLEKGYRHYLENMFENETVPKLKPDSKYRIDIHSCSEAIICLGELSELFPDAARVCKNVTEWTISNLQSANGSFGYGILKSRFTGRVYKSRIAYIRWGQAWMLRALSAYISRFGAS